MLEYLKKLHSILTSENKKFLLLLLGLTIILSLIETVGISAIMPFISVASNPELINSGYYKSVYDFFGFYSKNSFVISFGFALILFYIFRSIYSVFYSYMLNKLSFGSYHQFAYRLFQSYVSLPYQEFTTRNTGVLTKTIINEANSLTVLIQNILVLFSEGLTILFLYVMLLLINLKMTVILSLILFFKILLLTKALTKIIKRQGNKRFLLQEKFYRIINEAFGNFKIIKLMGNEKTIFDTFASASSGFARANVVNGTVSAIPKNVLEVLGFSALIGVVIYILYRYNDASFVIPIISMYALALYRILPGVNRILAAYNSMLFFAKSLEAVHVDICHSVAEEDSVELNFTDSIVLDKVVFSYNGDSVVIKNISLNITKGEKVAIVGESGSGKSTLVDLIIGIYKPTHGSIAVDGEVVSDSNIKSWRKKIGYIPQSIYLFDGTVAENVVFGFDYDESKIIEVLKKANIWDFLSEKHGIHTMVGDGGIQLSGGQKQRIGIARALYSDPEILVLDEATSALDSETETKIMDEIYDVSGDKTLIVVAHRLTTIERCKKVYKLEKGIIV